MAYIGGVDQTRLTWRSGSDYTWLKELCMRLSDTTVIMPTNLKQVLRPIVPHTVDLCVFKVDDYMDSHEAREFLRKEAYFSPLYLQAIRSWTLADPPIHKRLNREALSAESRHAAGKPAERFVKAVSYVKLLNDALQHLPQRYRIGRGVGCKKGKVWRFVDHVYEDVKSKFPIGSVVPFFDFKGTARTKEAMERFANDKIDVKHTQFEMDPWMACSIREFSEFPDEDEVLFPVGSLFVVREVLPGAGPRQPDIVKLVQIRFEPLVVFGVGCDHTFLNEDSDDEFEELTEADVKTALVRGEKIEPDGDKFTKEKMAVLGPYIQKLILRNLIQVKHLPRRSAEFQCPWDFCALGERCCFRFHPPEAVCDPSEALEMTCTAEHVKGTYQLDVREINGCPYYARKGDRSTRLYFSDARVGASKCGWWIARVTCPIVVDGSNESFAWNPSLERLPPKTGWRIPWNVAECVDAQLCPSSDLKTFMASESVGGATPKTSEDDSMVEFLHQAYIKALDSLDSLAFPEAALVLIFGYFILRLLCPTWLLVTSWVVALASILREEDKPNDWLTGWRGRVLAGMFIVPLVEPFLIMAATCYAVFRMLKSLGVFDQ